MSRIRKWLNGFQNTEQETYRLICDEDDPYRHKKHYSRQIQFTFPSRKFFMNISTRRWVVLMLGLVLLLRLLLSPVPQLTSPARNPEIQNNLFHLLIPASKGGAALCKTVFSAAVHNYPTPRLLNWGQVYKSKKLRAGGSHIAKITGSLEYLNQLDPESDQELVMIIDGYDMWFQIRPNVMLDRYHGILERQNERIRTRLGRAVKKEDIRQTIIISSEKRCWTHTEDDVACYAVPESPLPEKIYGPQTDQILADEDEHRLIRPRWVNSGFILGPAGDMRKLMERAYEIAVNQPNNNPNTAGSDQAIFTQIFGEQEYQREVLRLRHLSYRQRCYIWILKLLDYEDARSKAVLGPHPTHKKMAPVPEGHSFEFGLGIDYLSELSSPIIHSFQHTGWLKHADTADIALRSKDLNIDPVVVTSLPDDIAASAPPFSFSSNAKTQFLNLEDVLVPQPWDSVPLYTDLWTGVVPGAVHLNIYNKKSVTSEWSKTWFFPNLRTQLNAAAHAPRGPVAVTEQGAWWSVVDAKGSVMAETADLPKWLSWTDLCGTAKDGEEIFRDGGGAWCLAKPDPSATSSLIVSSTPRTTSSTSTV